MATLRFDQEQDKLVTDEIKSFKKDKLHSKSYIMKMEENLRTLTKVEDINEFNRVRLTM